MLEDYLAKYLSSPKIIKKGQIIQSAGSTAAKAYYVKKGLLRSYTIDDNGKVHIFTFAPENWILSDLEAFAMSTETDLFIDAVEDSEIIEISQTTEDLYQAINIDGLDGIDKLFRRIAVLQRRVLLLMSASAMQRYEHFLETYPQLINRVPLKMIASYLGITPEALSNIRSKMRKKK